MTTQDTELEDISTISTKKLGMKFAQMIRHPTAVSLCLSSDNISVCLPEITAVLITTCEQSPAGSEYNIYIPILSCKKIEK